jgi:chromosomal replication initiator protein
VLEVITNILDNGGSIAVALGNWLEAAMHLEAGLYSCLNGGLAYAIEMPTREHRVQILHSKLPAYAIELGMPRLPIPWEVLEYVANYPASSIRELIGIFRTLVMAKRAHLGSLTCEDVRIFLEVHRKLTLGKLTVADITEAVCEYYGVTRTEMLSDRRYRSIARPRQVAMWLSRKLTTRSLPDIGRRLGGRDHSTVHHAFHKIEELKEVDEGLASDLIQLQQKLRVYRIT